jgi:hypothetical protein
VKQESSMLLDLVSAIELTSSAAILTTALSFALAPTARGRVRAAGLVVAWFAAIVSLGASGVFGPEHPLLSTAGFGLVAVVPALILASAFLVAGPIRAAMRAIPMPVLIAIHSVRVLGFSFLMLYAEHRLPAPFAPIAGGGDMLIGLAAPPIAWIVARGAAAAGPLALAWSALGLLDLVAAVFLGATSTPGPVRLFMEAPGSGIMTTLPWILIPCFLVPILIATQVAVLSRLAQTDPVRTRTDDLGRRTAHVPG